MDNDHAFVAVLMKEERSDGTATAVTKYEHALFCCKCGYARPFNAITNDLPLKPARRSGEGESH